MDNPLHSLLRRQLKRHGFAARDMPAPLTGLLNSVSNAYVQSDDDRKMLERSLELSSQELLHASAEQSRLNRQLAGMAEVATGVLHNVGNVLTSVNVSASVIGAKLRDSRVDKLRSATVLLRERNGQLADYLINDPKGRILPNYLASVADQLASHQREMLAEMSLLTEHIEHIRQIISIQQDCSRTSGSLENFPPQSLVRDVLRMNSSAFDRHSVRVAEEYAPGTPDVCVDRHRMLQILINLIRNAKYAVEHRDAADRRITVRVGSDDGSRVRISITDNGIGIAPDNLIKIFNYGFTTKKDGHGFGLHSSANAAREMGGSLAAHSDGPDKGARFTLEVPAAMRGIDIPAGGRTETAAQSAGKDSNDSEARAATCNFESGKP